MNPVEKAIRKLDATQRRYTPTAFVFGVVKKYGDDNGGVLASNLAYSAFVSIFPLLLILTTILGLVASVNPSVRTQVLNAVAGQVPLIGKTLTGNVHQLQRSSIIGLIIGFVGLIWGASGLAQAGLFTMEQVWNLPGPARPGFVQRLGPRDAVHRPARRRRGRHHRAGQPQHLRAQGLLGGESWPSCWRWPSTPGCTSAPSAR